MKQGVVRAVLVGAMVIAMVVGFGVSAAAVPYQAPIDLGPGMARAINNLGQAVGDDAYSVCYGGHAVLWENGSTVPTPLIWKGVSTPLCLLL